MSDPPHVVMKLEYAVRGEDMGSYTPFQKKKFGRARRFYGCHNGNGDRNYVNYVNDGSKEKIDYVAYSGDGEKSCGAFDRSGLMDEKRRAELKKKLRTTGSVIWYGFISFTTEFGNRYVNGQEDACRLMATELPKFFRAAGFDPENITWYAGLHENTLHRHIHFSFFENEPSRYTARERKNARYSKGRISPLAMARFKVNVERRLTDITAELKIARKNVTDVMQSVLFTDGHRARLTREVQERLLELAEALPEDGRLSYASANMEQLRPMIDGITDLIIRGSPKLYAAFNKFCDKAIHRDDWTKKMLTDQKIPEKYWGKDLIAEKMLEDVYRRLGNYVINTARTYKNKQKPGAARVVRKKAKKQSTAGLLTHCLNMGAHVEREGLEAFREYMERLKEAERAVGSGREQQHENEME
jgi:hypothetical protein